MSRKSGSKRTLKHARKTTAKPHADRTDTADSKATHGAHPPHSDIGRLLVSAQSADVFRSPEGVIYATVGIGKHHETHKLNGSAFRQWLAKAFRAQHQRLPGPKALDEALTLLAGEAAVNGVERPVSVRVAGHGEDIFLDMGDPDWHVLRIFPGGHQVLNQAPVRFRRPPGMEKLPDPQPSGDINLLKGFLNVDEDQFRLLVGALVAAFRPNGQYPVLELKGEQGSGKTTTTKILRKLIDPRKSPTKTLPKSVRELAVAGTNAWLLAFDNVSFIGQELSDAMCQVSTGGAFTTRKLYTDDEEAIFDLQRPIIINGIGNLARRSDLLDRVVSVTLAPIDGATRRDEETFWRQFEEVRPAIFGALVDAVKVALRDVEQIVLPTVPRLADFARWVTAAEPALGWKEGTFLQLYDQNRMEGTRRVLEESITAVLIRNLISTRPWEGTATELLSALVVENGDRSFGLPSNASALGVELEQLAPNLRRVGIRVAKDRVGHGGERMIRIEQGAVSPVSAVSEEPQAA